MLGVFSCFALSARWPARCTAGSALQQSFRDRRLCLRAFEVRLCVFARLVDAPWAPEEHLVRHDLARLQVVRRDVCEGPDEDWGAVEGLASLDASQTELAGFREVGR